MKRLIRPQPPVRPTPVPRSQSLRLLNHAWLSHHIYLFFFSLGQLLRTPLPSLMTAAVIGIALAFPTGLYLLLENFQQISQNWGGTVQISLFLKAEVGDENTQILIEQLRQWDTIENVRLITPAEALQEYRQLSGFGDALEMLEENPLPAVLVIKPHLTQENTEILVKKLAQLPEVDIAQLDMQWLKRLFAMITIMRQGILILSCLLALAVLLTIGNTIRLAIYNRREEIEVHKLFGATDAFIRRPFLYSGLWYGFCGALIAWVLVNGSFWLLQEPVKHLTALYYSQFELITLNIFAGLILLASGILLGLIGAWLSVGRHLKDIQPR